MNITFRKALDSDTDYLLWLRKASMEDHLIRAGFEVNEENHLKGLLHKFEDAHIILLDEQKIGLLKLSLQEGVTEIIQVQIQPEHQCQGIGQHIIKSILSDAAKTKSAVSLSVLKENKALKLYERLGFSVTDENEHSFIMRAEAGKGL